MRQVPAIPALAVLAAAPALAAPAAARPRAHRACPLLPPLPLRPLPPGPLPSRPFPPLPPQAPPAVCAFGLQDAPSRRWRAAPPFDLAYASAASMPPRATIDLNGLPTHSDRATPRLASSATGCRGGRRTPRALTSQVICVFTRALLGSRYERSTVSTLSCRWYHFPRPHRRVRQEDLARGLREGLRWAPPDEPRPEGHSHPCNADRLHPALRARDHERVLVAAQVAEAYSHPAESGRGSMRDATLLVIIAPA